MNVNLSEPRVVCPVKAYVKHDLRRIPTAFIRKAGPKRIRSEYAVRVAPEIWGRRLDVDVYETWRRRLSWLETLRPSEVFFQKIEIHADDLPVPLNFIRRNSALEIAEQRDKLFAVARDKSSNGRVNGRRPRLHACERNRCRRGEQIQEARCHGLSSNSSPDSHPLNALSTSTPKCRFAPPSDGAPT